MTDDIKPASPLPWEWSDQGPNYEEALIYHSGRTDSRVDGAVADCVSDLYDYCQDAAYIVHTCNEYPRLRAKLKRVGALRDALMSGDHSFEHAAGVAHAITKALEDTPWPD